MIIKLSDLAPRLEADDNKVVGGGDKVDNKNLSKKSKNAKFEIQIYIGAMRELTFLTPGAKEAFN